MMKLSQGLVARPGLVAVGLWLWSCGWQTSPALPGADAGFRPEKLAEMDEAINQAIADKKCPGGVLWVEHSGAAYHRAYGHRALAPAVEPMTEDTIFDAASLTKVVNSMTWFKVTFLNSPVRARKRSRFGS